MRLSDRIRWLAYNWLDNPLAIILSLIGFLVLVAILILVIEAKHDKAVSRQLSEAVQTGVGVAGEVRNDISLPVFYKTTTCVVVLDGHEYFWISSSSEHRASCALTHKADCKFCKGGKSDE